MGPVSTVNGATAAITDSATDGALIQYVSTFVPKQTGQNFNPHVSTGVAPREYLDQMLAEPFGHSPSHRRAPPCINWVRTARLQRNSKNGI
jgi:hypothetical protein